MHEQTTKEFGKMNICMSIFGVRIGWRNYLNACTPFGYVSLWNARSHCLFGKALRFRVMQMYNYALNKFTHCMIAYYLFDISCTLFAVLITI